MHYKNVQVQLYNYIELPFISNVMKPHHTTETQYISDLQSVVPHLTDVVAAGGSDGLVDHLLTHDAVEFPLDTTQQTSLSKENNANQYTTLQYSVEYSNIVPCVFLRKYYRIAGNFRGAKYSWFSWFNTGPLTYE